MGKTVFNPDVQQLDLSSKVVAGLERTSQAFRALLWDKAKELGLSPIQIQLLIFVGYHKTYMNNVSFLAQEFNVTKPTISDAVKVLDKKGLIEKEYSLTDSRSYSILPSAKGKKMISATEDFATPILESLKNLGEKEQEQFFKTLSTLLFQLNKKGVLSVQRTCYGCRFHQSDGDAHYCNLLQKPLLQSDIRIDCPEYEPRSA